MLVRGGESKYRKKLGVGGFGAISDKKLEVSGVGGESSQFSFSNVDDATRNRNDDPSLIDRIRDEGDVARESPVVDILPPPDQHSFSHSLCVFPSPSLTLSLTLPPSRSGS